MDVLFDSCFGLPRGTLCLLEVFALVFVLNFRHGHMVGSQLAAYMPNHSQCVAGLLMSFYYSVSRYTQRCGSRRLPLLLGTDPRLLPTPFCTPQPPMLYPPTHTTPLPHFVSDLSDQCMGYKKYSYCLAMLHLVV